MNLLTQPSETIEEASKRGVISRSTLYSVVSAHSHEAIETLILLLQSRNDNVRLGAAKAILDKCLPDVKAIEIKPNIDVTEKLIIIKAGNDFITPI